MKNQKINETAVFLKTLRQGFTGKPAQNGKVPQVLFGTVTQFKPERCFGIAVVDYSKDGGIKRGFSLSTQNGPFLIGTKTSSSFPEFIRLSEAYPPKGAEVVLEVSGLNGAMRVVRWGCAKAYQEAKQTITCRPTFRLMYWKGGVDEELAQGSALGINAKFPRGDKDPLAKYIAEETKSGSYLYWQRQEPKDFTVGEKNRLIYSTETIWVETGDPRPMQASIQNKQPAPIVAPTPVVGPRKPAASVPRLSTMVGKSDLNRGFSKRFCSLEELALA